MAERPRFPRNLQGLLKFAMEATASEDAPNPSTFEQMDPERKKFLEEVLKSMSGDIVEEMTKAVNCLQDPESTEEELVNAIEIVSDFIQDIDIANDFCKIGGLTVIHPLLDSESVLVRQSTAIMISDLTQNNPYAQKLLLDLDVMPRLINLLGDDCLDMASCAMNAISCLIRQYEPATKQFVEMPGGLECLVGCLESDKEKLTMKAAFLATSLCQDEAIRDKLISLGATERLLKNIHSPEIIETYDHLLEAKLCLLCLFVTSEKAVEQCRKHHEQMAPIIAKIETQTAQRPEYEEINEYCETIMRACFSHCKVSDDTDR